MAKSASAGNRSLSQLFAFMSLAHALIALAAIRRASSRVSGLATVLERSKLKVVVIRQSNEARGEP